MPLDSADRPQARDHRRLHGHPQRAQPAVRPQQRWQALAHRLVAHEQQAELVALEPLWPFAPEDHRRVADLHLALERGPLRIVGMLDAELAPGVLQREQRHALVPAHAAAQPPGHLLDDGRGAAVVEVVRQPRQEALEGDHERPAVSTGTLFQVCTRS